MSDVVGTEGQGIAPQEQRESDNKTAFTIQIDKAGLEAERANIAPEGQATLDVILKLPDTLAIPTETLLIIGPNGIGKSTLLGVVELLGAAVSWRKNRAKENQPEEQNTWENAIQMVIDPRGKPVTERKKLGIAPDIARHVSVVDGADNIGRVIFARVPEEAGKLWNMFAEDEMGYLDSTATFDSSGNSREVTRFTKGTMARDTGVVGSTQQIIDRQVFKGLEDAIARGDGPHTILLDEPTANADLQRSLGLFKELNQINSRIENRAHFIIASNEGLLALNRNVPRIDMSHPERGVHFGKDFPIEEDTLKALQDMGYAPT